MTTQEAWLARPRRKPEERGNNNDETGNLKTAQVEGRYELIASRSEIHRQLKNDCTPGTKHPTNACP